MSALSAAAFAAALKEFRDDLRQAVKEERDEILLEAFASVSAMTPVLTGRARNSWNPSYGSMDLTVPPFMNEPGLQKAFEPAGSGNNWKTAAFVVSALDYIVPLEEGYSAKGSHMVEKTINNIAMTRNSVEILQNV